MVRGFRLWRGPDRAPMVYGPRQPRSNAPLVLPEPVPATIPEDLGTALATRYALERPLGAGGMATVYLAHDRKHGRPVAVKVLRPELASTMGAGRFLREIEIAARLQHPHILTLIDSGEVARAGDGAPPLLYYVMPYVAGESLRSRLSRAGPLPVPEVVQILREVADALAYAHRHGIVHRDMKPENVMLAERHALVVDFGVAKAMIRAQGGETLTGTGISVGTPAYMAPEQVAADPGVAQRADIYAVGVLAYEMLTGRPPFAGAPQLVLSAHLTTEPTPLPAARPDTPPALARVVARCLEKDPARRYQSADDLRDELAALEAPAGARAAARGRAWGRPWLAAVVVATVAAAALAVVVVRGRRERWVHEFAVPAIQQLSDAWESDSAFVLAERASAIAPGDSVLNSLWPRFSRRQRFVSEPAGATVYRARFDDTTRWTRLGVTPTDSVRVPSALARYRFEKPGYRPATVLAGGFIPGRAANTGALLPRSVPLQPATSPDSDMVVVAGGALGGGLPGLAHLPPVSLGAYRIDRHEVTNRQYKAFVDAGGYARREFWTEAFVDGERPLTWEQGIARLTDRTGRPGPATWEAGAPPAGQDDLPVGGVSWYEAAAYARFAGKALPTVYHWSGAAVVSGAAWVVPGSNFVSGGPRPGSRSRGMSPWGVFDMAGNVREWCRNADGQGQRYILGGGWSDLAYRFTDPFAQPPLDRSPINGIRLARYASDEPNLAAAAQPIRGTYRDYRREVPASDALFATYRRMYDYDRTPLNARVEERDTTPADWVREVVSFDAAYGRERVPALLFLPKRHRPPYQTVVLFPGSNALYERSSRQLDGQLFDYLMRSGRAVLLPIYKGTYERGGTLENETAGETIVYRDHVIMWAKDLRRSVDYLATRADVDSARLAYVGISWGGRMGGLLVALEPRFKVAIFNVAGLSMSRSRPETDPVNFLPRIRIPSLMLNGMHDHFFPPETSQQPFFRLLGTPPSLKRHVTYEGGHSLPRALVIRESLAWLDEHLGPAAR